MSLAHDLESRKNFADDARHLGLADAGRPGEHHVLADRGDIETLLAAHLLDLHACDQRFDLLLDRDKANQRVQFGDRGGDPGFVVLGLLPGRRNDVVDGDKRNVGRHVAGDPQRLRFPGFFKQRPHLAGIGPVLRLGPALEPWFQLGFEAIGEVELLPGRHAPEDFRQFAGVVAREIHGLAEAAAQARIAVDEAAHFVAVARDDDDDAVAIVLHEFQQGVDRFLAEVLTAAFAAGAQAVGLVDEQDAVERLAAFVERLWRGLPKISRDQAGAVRLHDVPLAQNPERCENFADQARHLGLADAGRSCEHHVLAERGNVETLIAAHLLDLHARDQRLDLLLDRGEADHGVEPGDRGGDFGLVLLGLLPGRGNQVLDGEKRNVGRRVGGEPQRLRLPRLLQQGSHFPRIGPVFRLRPALDPRPQPGRKAIGQVELLPGRHALEDFGQFRGCVGRKLDRLAEAAAQARIAVDETPHLVSIAGDDHDDAVAVVFHELQQRVDRFLAGIVIVAVLRGQGVGLVDEQNAVERLAAFFQGSCCGLPDISRHHAGAIGLDDMPSAKHLQASKDIADEAGDFGLADAGRPGEHHVLAERRHIQPLIPPLLLDRHARNEAFDFLFDRRKPDHGVEPGKCHFQRRRLGRVVGVDNGNGADQLGRIQHRRLGMLVDQPHGDQRQAQARYGNESDRKPRDHHVILATARRPHQIGDFDVRKVGGRIGRDSHRLCLACPFQQRAHLPCVGPFLGTRSVGNPRLDPGLKPLGQGEMLLCRHAAEDLAQIVGAVGRKIDGLGKASGQARIGVDEAAHLVGIAGDDHHDAVAVVFHEFEQRIDRFPAEVSARSGRSRKRVGFVDEQDAVQRFVALRQHFWRGLPDESGDDVGAVNLDQMPDAQRPKRPVDMSERTRDLGLADARRSGEHHVQAQRCGRQSLRAALLFDLQPRDQAVDLALDRDKANHGFQIFDGLVGWRIGNLPLRGEQHLDHIGQAAGVGRLQRAGSRVAGSEKRQQQADAREHQSDHDAAQSGLGRRRKSLDQSRRSGLRIENPGGDNRGRDSPDDQRNRLLVLERVFHLDSGSANMGSRRAIRREWSGRREG